MARPKLGEGVTLRLQVLVPEEEIPAIDDWGFANRIGNRSAAVRRLCTIGLEADALRAENERLRVTLRRLRDATPASTNSASAKDAFGFVYAVAATALDEDRAALSEAQP